MSMLTELQKSIYQNAKNHGFWEPRTEDRTPECLVLIASEITEAQDEIEPEGYCWTVLAKLHNKVSRALEAFRVMPEVDGPHADVKDAPVWYEHPETGQAWAHAHDAPGGLILKPQGVGSELADIVIRCLDLAEHLQFDLGQVIAEKHAFNVTRPHKHGKRL